MNRKNNKTDELFNLFGEIDDEILESALNYKRKKHLPLKKILSIAACFAFVIIVAFVFNNVQKSPDDTESGILSPSNESESVNSEKNPTQNDDIDCSSDTNEGFEDFSDQQEKNPTQNDDIDYSSDTNEGFKDFSDQQEENEETETVSSVSKDDLAEEGDEEFRPGMNLPPLKDEVKINDLNKLAYYSGWTMLRKHGSFNLKALSSYMNKKGIKLLSEVRYDTSEEDIGEIFYPDFHIDVSNEYSGVITTNPEIFYPDFHVDVSDEYSGLIPKDPLSNGAVIVYGVYSITVNSVEYFQVEISQNCFLTDQIGNGNIEVMILEVKFDNNISDTMVVFKNEDRFFSCLLDKYIKSTEGDRIFTFTASKYVSNFSIVKMPTLSDYSFKISFKNNGTVVPEIFFEYTDIKSEGIYNNSILKETYNNAYNISVTNSALRLDEELYKIYHEEVAGGIVEPILPEKPNVSEKPYEPDISQDVSSGEPMKVNVSFKGLFTGKANFEKNGCLIFKGGSMEAEKLKKQISIEELSAQIDSISDEITYVAIWINGRARLSEYQFYINNATVLGFEINYITFEDTDDYTLYLFELWKGADISSIGNVVYNEVNYSTTVVATFTTENKYDVSSENVTEDEYVINLDSNGLYYMYKNGKLVYENAYKVSWGRVCLSTDNDVLYLELSSVSTFEYEIEGTKRIFSLV